MSEISKAQWKALGKLSKRIGAAHHTQIGTTMPTMRSLFEAGYVSLSHECSYSVWTITEAGRAALARHCGEQQTSGSGQTDADHAGDPVG